MHWIPVLLVLLLYMFRATFVPHHQEFLAVHRLWYILCSCDEPFATRSRMKLQFHPTPGSKRSQLHKMYQSRCTAKNSWWWAERLPETCRVVISIKLEFSAFVGFIHKEFFPRVYSGRCVGLTSHLHHVSRLRKLLLWASMIWRGTTFSLAFIQLFMLYEFFSFSLEQQPLMGQDLLIDASWSHSDSPHSIILIWTSDLPLGEDL